MKKTKGALIRKKLDELGSLPTLTIQSGTILYRQQKAGYAEGFHFRSPPDIIDMGRYDAVDMRVCYFAQTPDISLAEFFLRKTQVPDMWDGNDLVNYDIAQVRIVSNRPLKMLDISSLLPLIGHKLDELTSVDYALTQAIVSYFSGAPKHRVDGIAFIGRHLSNGLCYAVFEPEDDGVSIQTESLIRLDKFVCPDTNRRGEEIMTNTLGIKVTYLD